VDRLPDWPEQTVAVLSTGAGAPHAIPVSTAVRRDERTIVLALGLRRESLARLRADPRCALTVMAAGNLAFTAHGRASIEELEAIARITLHVESLQDHSQPSFEITEGVGWHWTSDDAVERDARTRSQL
jgi:hypothetical protein